MTARLLKNGCFAMAIGVLSISVQAGVIDCPTDMQALVTNTSACQYSDNATQDFLNTDPMTVNGQEFFGANDWSFITKDDDVEARSGLWHLGEGIREEFQDIMLVFKGGRGTSLVGYRISAGASSGVWESPFGDAVYELKNPRDVSHISYYGRGVTELPEPDLAVLFLLGLGGVALGRLRKRAISETT